MTLHPFDPDHPDYDQLRDAGRVGPRHQAPALRYGCVGTRQIRPGTYTRCNDPAAPYRITKAATHLTVRSCDEHFGRFIFTEDGRPEPGVSWSVACSVCDTPADYRSRLDDSGRCDRCRP